MKTRFERRWRRRSTRDGVRSCAGCRRFVKRPRRKPPERSRAHDRAGASAIDVGERSAFLGFWIYPNSFVSNLGSIVTGREKRPATLDRMQLHVARLCLDCNEVHETDDCPRCGSETFAYLSRWVPAPERRVVARPASSPDAEVYKELIDPPTTRRRGRMLKGGALGIGVLAAAGWFLRRRDPDKSAPSSKPTRESSTR